MNKISTIIYAFFVALVGYFIYQYTEYILYIVGISITFIILNFLVFSLYKRFREQSMALMKFMGVNFLKDIIWAVFWMFFIKDNGVLAVFTSIVFLFLSIPLYISVLERNKK